MISKQSKEQIFSEGQSRQASVRNGSDSTSVIFRVPCNDNIYCFVPMQAPQGSNLLRNSYGYQIIDPPPLRSPNTRHFPTHPTYTLQQDSIRSQESKLEGVESLIRKRNSQAETQIRGFPQEEPLTEQLLRGSCQNVIRKFDYTALRNTTQFNPQPKFPTQHNELKRSPGREDPSNRGVTSRNALQEPANAFLRPAEKKPLDSKPSFLQAKTPPKMVTDKQIEEKQQHPSRTPTKYKSLFENSPKTSATLRSPEEDKKNYKALNQIADNKEREKEKERQKERVKVNMKRSGEAQNLVPKSPILNGFQLGSTLGKGKFGEVFLVRHHESGFIAALKRTEKKKVREFKMIDQFCKQIRLHSSLDHPNIVKFYGCFQDQQEVFLVMQYMNGGTLFDYLNEVTVLPLKEAVEYLRDVIEALTYLHDRSIAHRDIKPQNIVLSSEGVAKLCDFGWSAVVETSRRTYCGTFDYAPPEVLQRKNYDTSVDIWCIGVLTYELLTGRVPFEGDKRNIVMEKILNVDKSSIEYPPEVPPEAKEFIQALVQKDPSQRPKCHDLLKFRLFTQHLSKTHKPKRML